MIGIFVRDSLNRKKEELKQTKRVVNIMIRPAVAILPFHISA